MKTRSTVALSLAAILATATLAGCASGPTAEQHRQRHPDAAAAQGWMGMGAGPGGKGMMMSDTEMKAMCARHQEMMRATTPEQRMAMMDEHIKSMSPEMRKQHMQHHMEMMQRACQ